nr:MAG TPA: hypothetical protein [Caudoviricetes sp.]
MNSDARSLGDFLSDTAHRRPISPSSYRTPSFITAKV